MLDHSCQVKRAPLDERKDDLYETPDVAVHALLRVEKLPEVIWECACGPGRVVKLLRAAGDLGTAARLLEGLEIAVEATTGNDIG